MLITFLNTRRNAEYDVVLAMLLDIEWCQRCYLPKYHVDSKTPCKVKDYKNVIGNDEKGYHCQICGHSKIIYPTQ